MTGFVTLATAVAFDVECAAGACYFSNRIGSARRLRTGATSLEALPGSPAETYNSIVHGGGVYFGSIAGVGVRRFDIAAETWSQLCDSVEGRSALGIDGYGNLIGSGITISRCPAGATAATPWTSAGPLGDAYVNGWATDAAGNTYLHDGDGGDVWFIANGAASVSRTTFRSSHPGLVLSEIAAAPNGDIWTTSVFALAAAFRQSAGSTTWQEVSSGLDTAPNTSRGRSTAFHVDSGGNVLMVNQNTAGVHTLYRLAPGSTTWSTVISGNGLPTTPTASNCNSMSVDGAGRLVLICNANVLRSTP